MTGEIEGLVERLRSRLGHVETPCMDGDNLAVTLCSHFDDGEGEQDDNGWTEAATAGCDEVLTAIHANYAAALTAQAARIAELEGVLRPFAPALKDDLPDDHLVEAIAHTAGDYRAARAALAKGGRGG